MRRIITFTLVFALTIGQACPLWAWSKAGHMVTGAIAYERMKQKHPAKLAKVLAILKSHPHYETKWAEALATVAAEDRDLVRFMLAARWPDDIRDIDEFNRPTHHYINIPFKPADAPDSVVPPEPPAENIIFAFRKNFQVAKSASATESEKAIAICWLFHLTGDGHQPLHSSTLFNAQYPQGDRGGTRFYVKERTGNVVHLHSFWDSMVFDTDNYQDAKVKAQDLQSALPDDDLMELAAAFVETDFDKWIRDESYALAKKAYQADGLKGGTMEESAELLPATYRRDFQPVAKRRMVLAGYRLADVLANSVP